MSRTHRILFAVCTFILLTGAASVVRAQESQAGIDFMTLFPQGQFKQNVGNNGYGVGVNYMVGLGRTPVFVGGDFSYVRYGSTSHEEDLGDILVKVQTNNNILMGHFVLRLQPRTGKVRPYIDGLIGFKNLRTVTNVIDVYADPEDELISSEKNFGDTALSYGVGGGVQIQLAGSDRRGVFFDSKVRWLRGGRAEYLREGSIREVDGGVVYDVYRSRTDAVGMNFGIGFRF